MAIKPSSAPRYMRYRETKTGKGYCLHVLLVAIVRMMEKRNPLPSPAELFLVFLMIFYEMLEQLQGFNLARMLYLFN